MENLPDIAVFFASHAVYDDPAGHNRSIFFKVLASQEINGRTMMKTLDDVRSLLEPAPPPPPFNTKKLDIVSKDDSKIFLPENIIVEFAKAFEKFPHIRPSKENALILLQWMTDNRVLPSASNAATGLKVLDSQLEHIRVPVEESPPLPVAPVTPQSVQVGLERWQLRDDATEAEVRNADVRALRDYLKRRGRTIGTAEKGVRMGGRF